MQYATFTFLNRGYRSPLTFLETFPSSSYMSGCYVPASLSYNLLSTPVFGICEYTTEFTLIDGKFCSVIGYLKTGVESKVYGKEGGTLQPDMYGPRREYLYKSKWKPITGVWKYCVLHKLKMCWGVTELT